MEIKEGILFEIDFNNDGGAELTIMSRKEDGSIRLIKGDALKEYLTTEEIPEDNDPAYGKMEYKNEITVKAFSASPLKVWIKVDGRKYCYRVDRNTGEILGRC